MCFFDILLKLIVILEELDPAKGHLCEVEYWVSLEADTRGVSAFVAQAYQVPVQCVDRSSPERMRFVLVGGQERSDQQRLHWLIAA